MSIVRAIKATGRSVCASRARASFRDTASETMVQSCGARWIACHVTCPSEGDSQRFQNRAVAQLACGSTRSRCASHRAQRSTFLGASCTPRRCVLRSDRMLRCRGVLSLCCDRAPCQLLPPTCDRPDHTADARTRALREPPSRGGQCDGVGHYKQLRSTFHALGEHRRRGMGELGRNRRCATTEDRDAGVHVRLRWELSRRRTVSVRSVAMVAA